jgi:ankyrin repeat protein
MFLVGLLVCVVGCASLIADINPVLKAVVSENPKKVKRAAQANQDALDEVNVCGAGALHLAIQNGSFEIVEILLAQGANPNLYSAVRAQPSSCSDYFLVAVPAGFPPLHYAIYAAQPRIAELLYANGADPMLLTTNGQSALALARGKVGLEGLVAQIESELQ